MGRFSRVSAGKSFRACLLVFVVTISVVDVSLVRAEKGPSLTWSRTYQNQGNEIAQAVQQTFDGGFIVAGNSFAGALVMKVNPAGLPEWGRTYIPAGYYNAWPVSVQQTTDRGYIVGGYAASIGYVTLFDGWLLKLDRKGAVEWSKTYGGPKDDVFSSVSQTSDGGYIATGNTASFGSPFHYINGWILKLDQEGNVLWQEAFGGEDVSSIQQTTDGGFVVVGTVGVDHNADVWVFKLDPAGNMAWQKAIGAPFLTQGKLIQQTSDGGFVVVAERLISGEFRFDSSNAWIFRLDPEANILWQRSVGGGSLNEPFSVSTTPDGGFVIAGTTGSETPGNAAWLFKLDHLGNLVWQKFYGGNGEFFQSVQSTRDGGLVVAGAMSTITHGLDFWVMKMDSQGSVHGCNLGSPSDLAVTNTTGPVVVPAIQGLDTNATVTTQSVSVVTTRPQTATQCAILD